MITNLLSFDANEKHISEQMDLNNLNYYEIIANKFTQHITVKCDAPRP
jgi:hypothetical protein